MFCDNSRTHIHPDDKTIFGDGKIILCFLPPNMAHLIHPIYASLGRVLRLAIGNYLDKWLLVSEILERGGGGGSIQL